MSGLIEENKTHQVVEENPKSHPGPWGKTLLMVFGPVVVFGIISALGYQGCYNKKFENKVLKSISCFIYEFGLIAALNILWYVFSITVILYFSG